MRWDWYAATVHVAEPEEVVGELLARWDLASVRTGRARHGYLRAVEVCRGDRLLCVAYWGGNPGVHVVGTGEDAPAVADALRACWPVHRVTRADVAEDYRSPRAWSSLSRLALDVADRYGLRVYQAGDYHRGEAGRTVYVGSPQAVAQLRVYEKGRQMGMGTDPDWVRVELVCRPRRAEARERMAALSPGACWGITAWTADLVQRLGASEVERIRAGTVWRASDDQRARMALLRQYGRVLRSWADEVGGWSALGPVIAAELARDVESVH